MSISNLIWDFVYSTIQIELCRDKLSQWRTLSSSIHKDSSSYRIRVLLNSKRGKRRITEAERMAISTKQMKQRIKRIMVVTLIR